MTAPSTPSRLRWPTIEPLKAWLVLSLVIGLTLLVATKSPAGELLGRFTDHFHHARATWTVLHVGLDAYKRPFRETGNEVAYPQFGVTWEQFPITYPPGMFVLFFPLALIGRFVPMSTPMFGKVGVFFMLVLIHAALWRLALLLRGVRTPFATPLLVMIWIFGVYCALLGFYDGSWLLCGLLAAAALLRGANARALLWLVAAALLSYRASSLAPLGLVAAWRLLHDPIPWRSKLLVGLASVAGCGMVIAAFWALLHYGPTDEASLRGATSSLLPLSFKGEVVIAGSVVAALLSMRFAGLVTGLMVALSSALALHHAGHTWHGFICIAPVLGLGVFVPRQPTAATVTITAWLAFMWQFAFDYQPLRWLHEVMLFVEHGGLFPN